VASTSRPRAKKKAAVSDLGQDHCTYRNRYLGRSTRPGLARGLQELARAETHWTIARAGGSVVACSL
jgi:hypothetical protein